MKKGNDKIIQNMKKAISEVKKSSVKAKEIINKSGIYTKKGNLKSKYT
jgi:hypothetical protein